MKKIPHLEDLAITEDSEDLQKIIDDLSATLAGENRGLLTPKIDGCPCVYFGRDEEGRFWVSTKSYLNREPIQYFSEAEIKEAGRPQELEQKLIWLFRTLELDLSIKPNEVYGGDLIASPWSRTENGYRPNIIEYRFDQPIKEPSFFLHHYRSSRSMELGKIIPDIKSEFFQHLSFETLTKGIHVDPPRLDPTSNHVPKNIAEEIRKSINKAIRHRKDQYWKYRHGMEKNRHRNFEKLTQIKHEILSSLRQNEKGTMFIGEEQTNHEGYVFTTDYYTVKLVDRLEFSARNFDQNTIRGW